MRILKFILAFVVTGVVLFAIVIGLNWKSFDIFMNNREAFQEGSEWVPKTQSLRGLSEFIDENPQNVSIASIVEEAPDSTLLFEADTPRTLGSLSNIFLLTAYAVEMDDGRFSSEDTISVNEIEKYRLPQIDTSLQTDGLQFAEERGWLSDGRISLENALELLVHFNDPALSDYLWHHLEPFDWSEFRSRHSLEKTDMPLPLTGLYIHTSSYENDNSIEKKISDRKTLSEDDYRQHIIELADRFQTDDTFRSTILEQFENDRLGRSFIEERNALKLFPQGTASGLVSFLQSVWNYDNISETAANRLFDWMRSPYKNRSEIERDFTDYGALFDNRIGLLNGIDFGTLVYTGDTKFQVVIFDELPVGFWFHMSGNHMHQDFQQRLIYDPALVDLMINVADRNTE